MKRCGMISRWVFRTTLFIALSVSAASGDPRVAVSTGAPQDSAFRENPKDLLDLQKLTKRLDLSPAQQDSAGQAIPRMRNALETFAWDCAKLTCEASVWGTAPPAPEALRARKQKAIEDLEGLLKPFEETLSEAQKTRLRGGGAPGYLQAVGIEKVLLTDVKEGVRHLYVLDNKSGSARRLTTVPMRRSGVWSPDGRLIAYREMNEDGSGGSLNVMREDGTGVLRLVNYPTGPDISWLKWSPDGSRIAFRVGPPSRALHVIRPDGTSLTTVEALEPSAQVANIQGGFAWSPDGGALAYEAKYGEDAVPQVYLVNADGTGRRRLTGTSRAAESPSWSPTGGRSPSSPAPRFT